MKDNIETYPDNDIYIYIEREREGRASLCNII